MVHAPIWKAELGADRRPAPRAARSSSTTWASWPAASTTRSATGSRRPPTCTCTRTSTSRCRPSPATPRTPFPNLNIDKYVREMVDKMGPERCFWGTDLTRLMGHGLDLHRHHRAVHQAHRAHRGGARVDHGPRDLRVPRTGRSRSVAKRPDPTRLTRRASTAARRCSRRFGPRRRLRLLLTGLGVGAGVGGVRSPRPRRRRRGPRYLDLTHETLAVGMATGYALSPGRRQVVLLHAAPGLLQGARDPRRAAHRRADGRCSSESVDYGEAPGPTPASQWYRNLSSSAARRRWPRRSQVGEPGRPTSRRAVRDGHAGGGARRSASPAGPVYLNVPLEMLLAEWRPPPVRRAGRARWPSGRAPRRGRRGRPAARGRPAPVLVTETAGRDPEAFAALVAVWPNCSASGWSSRSRRSAPTSRAPIRCTRAASSPPPASADLDPARQLPCAVVPAERQPGRTHVLVIDEVPHRPHIVYQVLERRPLPRRRDRGDARARSGAAARSASTEATVARRQRRARGRPRTREAARMAADEQRRPASADAHRPGAARGRAARASCRRRPVVVDETITHSRLIARHLTAEDARPLYYVQGGLGQGIGVALGAKLALGPSAWSSSPSATASCLYNPMLPGADGVARPSACRCWSWSSTTGSTCR